MLTDALHRDKDFIASWSRTGGICSCYRKSVRCAWIQLLKVRLFIVAALIFSIFRVYCVGYLTTVFVYFSMSVTTWDVIPCKAGSGRQQSGTPYIFQSS